MLEVGIGTGPNLPFYDKARVRSIVGVDPALRMHRLALRRIRDSGLSVELIGLSAETLVAEDASFDTVVSTYTPCTIPDPLSALREMRRVLVPGGKLLFSEHGLAVCLVPLLGRGRRGLIPRPEHPQPEQCPTRTQSATLSFMLSACGHG